MYILYFFETHFLRVALCEISAEVTVDYRGDGCFVKSDFMRMSRRSHVPPTLHLADAFRGVLPSPLGDLGAIDKLSFSARRKKHHVPRARGGLKVGGFPDAEWPTRFVQAAIRFHQTEMCRPHLRK